ncbi:MAG: glycoside hydrolase family 3 N-terminal domain-containing protein [Bacteroidota bacterium]
MTTLLTVKAFSQGSEYSLEDFYKSNPALEKEVDQIFKGLNDTARVAQVIITSAGELGKPNEVVLRLASENKIGGVVFLKGTKASHKSLVNQLNEISEEDNHIPLLFSIDAEPSLVNGRLQGSDPIKNTIDIETTAESKQIATQINKELLEMGMHQNFAPVCDVSPRNAAIKNRSFGSDKDQVIEMSQAFIESTQEGGIVATAKHFPGHGLVDGDTHEQSVFINGELQELEVYPPLIEAGVLSIMTAHITIQNNDKYNTNGLPVSCSRNIVTGLLKEELGFEGLIITDALNIMKAVTIIEDAPLIASKAGNDMLLMPIDETETINSILAEMQKDEEYREQVYDSVKKIIRLKICAGVVN